MSKTSAVILTAFITIILTSMAWFAIGVVAYKAWLSEDSWMGDEPFIVVLDAPATANMDEVITLKVTATNIGEDTATLGSIDVYDTFLEGFDVVRITPKPKNESGIFGFQSYYFDGFLMEPGESATVSFELKASKAGTWEGDVDCCTPLENFSTAVATITVTDAAAQ